MELVKIPVVMLVLIARACRGEIVIATPSREDVLISRLVDDVIHMVTSCYGDRINGVGLAGTFSDLYAKRLSAQHLIPIVLLDRCELWLNEPSRAAILTRQKLQVFIVHASSDIELDRTMRQKIKPSIFWNPAATFFFLVESSTCKTYEYLPYMWTHGLIHANNVCFDFFKRKTLVIGHNPFVNRAPFPWKYYRVSPIFSRSGWLTMTEFSLTYRRNASICSSLDFEKMKDGGGRKIHVAGHPPASLVPVRTKANRAEYEHSVKMARILGTVFRTMHVKPVYTFRAKFDLPLAEDMVAASDIILSKWTDQFSTTYPHEKLGFVLVTQFRGHKSQLNKILTVTDVASRIGLGVVYLITLVFLKFFVRQALAPALLNLVRITCNFGLTNVLGDNPTRIYLTALLFFVVTMQGIYQGNLATLLTTRIPVRNVETMMDVMELGYELYGDPVVERAIPYPELRKRYIPVDVNDCISRVVEDPSAACMAILTDKIFDKAREFDLHVSGELIGTVYMGFTIRWDWHFEERINAVLSAMVEADVLEPWLHRCDPIKLVDFKYDKGVLSNTSIKVLELGELIFAFVILGIGLACAAVTFVAEVAIGSRWTLVRRDIVT